MGLLANYPVALAPGMGMNAFFAFYVIGALGYSWQQALAGIFISGLIFILLSATGVRELIINSIPQSLKYAVGTGIGFFITFIGLQGSGVIVANEATLVGLGNFKDPATALTLIGVIITLVLLVRKVPAAIFIGMVFTAIIGMFMGVVDLPTQFVSEVPSLRPTFGALFAALPDIFTLDMFTIIFAFLFVDFFDTAGTLMAVGARAGLINEKGELVDGDRALLADSTATVVGAVLGTSSTTSYIESLTGVEAGGRTGLTSVVTAGLFLLALFFSPLLSVVTTAVTAPALIAVGILMASALGHIEWGELEITIPSFVTIIVMLLSYSIADGIAAGFLFYVIMMVAAKRHKEVSLIMYILGAIFLIHFML